MVSNSSDFITMLEFIYQLLSVLDCSLLSWIDCTGWLPCYTLP